MATTERYIGSPVLRKEDPDLITGQAQYVDNMTMAGMVWMALVRPPYVHAKIDRIETTAAEGMPGVIGVYTAEDLGLGALPFVWPITEDIKVPVHYPLTKDKIRFNGDAVAVVVAQTREQALDATESVTVEANPLTAVTDENPRPRFWFHLIRPRPFPSSSSKSKARAAIGNNGCARGSR